MHMHVLHILHMHMHVHILHMHILHMCMYLPCLQMEMAKGDSLNYSVLSDFQCLFSCLQYISHSMDQSSFVASKYTQYNIYNHTACSSLFLCWPVIREMRLTFESFTLLRQ